MQLIACQTNIAWEDKQANFDRVEKLLSADKVKPGALVALPEMFATGFSMHVETIHEAADGPTHRFLAGQARSLKAFVMGGVVTRAKDGRGRNESVVFGPEGTLLCRYAKLQPFSLSGESKHYQAGEGVALFEWHDFHVSPFVCYDLRFPEIFREATRTGAQLITCIANWPAPRDAHWQALLRARAIENQAYVLGVNRVGDDPHISYAGHSLILGPRGETLAEGGSGEELLTAEIELEPLVEYRQQFPALADIRSDFFPD